MSVDVSGLTALAADLRKAGPDIARGAKGVVSKGALNVKTDWRKAFAGSQHFAQVGPSISYDTATVDGAFEAQIGPVSGPGSVVGDLAGIAHFGGAHGGGGTITDPQTFLDDEAPKFEAALLALVDGAL